MVLQKFAQDANGKDLMGKDGKPVPAIKQQDRQVVADDLDKTKNTDAVVLGTLTAMGLAVGDPYPVFQKDDAGKLKLDKDGHGIADPFTLSYKPEDAVTGKSGDAKDPETFNFHTSAKSVIVPHKMNFLFIQACIAILLLVGFESVTSMGEEAKNPKKDIGRAVLMSLVIQGAICYMFEYFAANYFLNSGYTVSNAGASGAPLGDMMVLVGTWAFGSYAAGRAFMLVQAGTVFLALIGTTLACINTGARVTYAMGRDEEVPSHFGLIHGKTLSPHRAIWALVVISMVIGIITTVAYLGGTTPAALDKHNIWYSFGSFQAGVLCQLPQHAGFHHPDQQLRHVPALHDDVHRGHRGVQRAPQLQRVQAFRCADLRVAGEPGLHVILSGWPVLGQRHELA